jgi:hypothetical protein
MEMEYPEIINAETAHALLKAVYQNPEIPLPVRMRAAMAAIPYESPRLQVTAVVSENSLAELLEQRLKRLKQMENGNDAKLIEPATPKQIAPPVEVKPPKPHINDRRYRRF